MSSNETWHVSRIVDVVFYHFSWLPPLLILLIMGEQHFQDYLLIYLAIMAANFVHRHFGLPYAYLDRGVFKTHKKKLIVFPSLCVLLFLLSPVFFLESNRSWGVPAVLTFAVIAALWNFYHTYMQKYGILRLYNKKGQKVLKSKNTPTWVDLMAIFSWLPLLIVEGFVKYRELILEQSKNSAFAVLPLLNFFESYHSVLVGPAILFLILGLGLFFTKEFNSNRFKNIPRLSMFAGTTLISASFLLFNPIKVFLAFAFSHAVEYIVFVIAFQKKKYQSSTKELSFNFLKTPTIFYTGFIFTLAFIYIFFNSVIENTLIFGLKAKVWLFTWAIYESFIHFYLDGFLWKVRRPQVNRYI